MVIILFDNVYNYRKMRNKLSIYLSVNIFHFKRHFQFKTIFRQNWWSSNAGTTVGCWYTRYTDIPVILMPFVASSENVTTVEIFSKYMYLAAVFRGILWN